MFHGTPAELRWCIQHGVSTNRNQILDEVRQWDALAARIRSRVYGRSSSSLDESSTRPKKLSLNFGPITSSWQRSLTGPRKPE